MVANAYTLLTVIRWSYGGNKLQMKAEVKSIADVITALQSTSTFGANPTTARQSLQQRQELLTILLQSEATRLNVWLSPLHSEGTLLHRNPGTTNEVSQPNIPTILNY